jgi:glutathione S-transferase
MVDKNIIFGYWAIRGKGQVPRLLLAYTGTKFTPKIYNFNSQVNREQWFVHEKQSLGLPFPNLPYLIDGDVKMTEMEAISWYIIERSNKRELEGKTIADRGMIGNINGVLTDIMSDIIKLFIERAGEKPNEKSSEEKEKTFTDKVKTKFDYIYKFLGDKDWLLGYLTFSDFNLS